MARLLATLVLTSAVLASAGPCAVDADCEFNGACHMLSCACSSGWEGPSCGSLRLLPAPTTSARLWPRAAEIASGGASAWGFSAPVYDAADGLYHAFSTVACGVYGVVGQGGGNSFIAHLTSASPDSGFTLRSAFTPQTTFGPMSAVAQDGTFVVIFRVNVLLSAPVCAGNGTDPMPPALLTASDVPAADLVSGDPELGTSIYVAWATRAAGPWSVARVNITGDGPTHNSNPSITQLPDGRWAMAYRYNPKGGSLNAVAISVDGFRGPYASLVNLTAGKPGDEDPFFYWSIVPPGAQGSAAPGDVIGHMLYHNRDFGYHAFGLLDGSSWSVSPTHSYAFTLNVTMDDGSVTRLSRRERPALRFDEQHRPLALLNGVQEGGAEGSCYSFEQPLFVAQ